MYGVFSWADGWLIPDEKSLVEVARQSVADCEAVAMWLLNQGSEEAEALADQILQQFG